MRQERRRAAAVAAGIGAADVRRMRTNGPPRVLV